MLGGRLKRTSCAILFNVDVKLREIRHSQSMTMHHKDHRLIKDHRFFDVVKVVQTMHRHSKANLLS